MEESNFEEYDKFSKDFWYIFARNDLLAKLISKNVSISGKKNLRILDLGCGTGFNYPVLSRFGKVYSVDIDKRALESCKRKGIPRLLCGDAEKIPFSDNFFDIVVAIELLEHIPDDRKAVGEVKRVMKKGGLFIFTSPAHKFLWSSDDVLAHHRRRYSKKGLMQLLDKGFKKSYLGYRYFFIFLPAVSIFFLQRLIKRKKKKDVNSLTMTPRFLNGFLKRLMALENSFIVHRIVLPWGTGLIGVFRKIR